MVTTARNTGHLRATIESVAISVSLGSTGSNHPMSLFDQNDFPILNPRLPSPLDVGSSFHWLTSLAAVEGIVRVAALSSLEVMDLWATARLGSGETLESMRYPLDLMPT
jgi:hypothetical protein